MTGPNSKAQRLTPQIIVSGAYPKIEDTHRARCAQLQWGAHTDVLYSFNRIFQIGIYLVDQFRGSGWFSLTAGRIIAVGGSGRKFLSKQYIREHPKIWTLFESEDRAVQRISKALENFAGRYDSIGNVFPIWPGGNSCKGTAAAGGLPAYDIPDLFFLQPEYRELERLYLTHILKLGGDGMDAERAAQAAQLSDFIGAHGSPLIRGSIHALLPPGKPGPDTLTAYARFVEGASGRIAARQNALEEMLSREKGRRPEQFPQEEQTNTPEAKGPIIDTAL